MKKTILSLEQALTLPYTTQRFANLGWRVIRVESPGAGDPNRYIGEDTGAEGLRSYFIAPNIGKEAITLNLKVKEGQELLKEIIRKLKVDVFLCNTLPKRYQQLGIDFATLREANPALIWCGISAFGPDYPGSAGYDPALQAFMGVMHLTGEPDRDPMLCGLPIIDLKAGDEAFAQILLAMLEQRESGGNKPKGREIFISMTQSFSSWLLTVLPQLQFVKDDSKHYKRCGNEHRSFIPCNCYPTKDGYVYLAIGSDSQWEKLTGIEGFAFIAKPERKTNRGRMVDKEAIYADIREALKNYSAGEFINICTELNLAVAPVNSIKDLSGLDFVKNNMLKTQIPSGEKVELFPVPYPTDFLSENENTLKCAPRLGEDNERIYSEMGLNNDEIQKLKNGGVI